MRLINIQQTASVFLADKARSLEKEGKHIIKFQTGDPFFSTPQIIVDSVYNSIQKGETHYSFAQGLIELRERIADQINQEINGVLDLQNVLITHGAAQAIFCVFNSILEYGDEVIILEPNWPTVNSAIIINGGVPKVVNFLEHDFSLDHLENVYSNKTKALIFNSPNNPTGTVFSSDMINAIINWAYEKGIYIIADEVYRFLQFTNYPSTSLNAINNYEKYIFIDSFSKKYAMTGFRIGYIASSKEVIQLLLKSSQINITHVSPFVQAAALAAITDKTVLTECNRMLEKYREHRDYGKDLFKENKIDFIDPQGAFYFFLKIPQRFSNDIEFSESLLIKENVCIVPGSAYGKSGSGYYRVSYSINTSELKDGLNKIINFYK